MSKHWDITDKDFGTVLTFLHDWDLDIANQFLSFIEENFEPENHKCFVFDLHLINHLDSMVIGIIISISKKIKKNGGHIFLLKPSKITEKMLGDIGLLSYFIVAYSEEEIIKIIAEAEE